jgi:HlyD family secretion protein
VDWNELRMARREKFRWGATGVAALFVIAALVLWIAPSRQTSSAQDGIRPVGPLISRGYTDAPAGTAVIAGDPASGGVIQELRVVDGQKVKKDEVVAVLSNYSKADVTVRTTEAELQKAKRQREAMVNGYRLAEITMQEVVVKSAADFTATSCKAISARRYPFTIASRWRFAFCSSASLVRTVTSACE